MKSRRWFGKTAASGLLALPAAAQQQPAPQAPRAEGSAEGAVIPGQKWKAHDRARPQARKVAAGLPIASPAPPSDAIVLFDGKDLSQWNGLARGGAIGEPNWKVENGYLELIPRIGSLATKEKFGDCQLHLEWINPPAPPEAKGQMRGNSGVLLMGRYEIQVLSSFDNPTYADGAAGSIYGLYPPLVNPCRPEGEWNSYEIIFEAPRFEDGRNVKPAFVTLIFNGVLAHHRAQLLGSTAILPLAQYRPHAPEESLVLQGHAGPVRYRNIWIRRLAGYDA